MALVNGQFRLGAIRTSRAWIRSRSNSTMPPRTVSVSRPCGVVASAQPSPRDLNPVPFSAMVARIFSRAQVERARRLSRVINRVSSASSLSIASRSLIWLVRRREPLLEYPSSSRRLSTGRPKQPRSAGQWPSRINCCARSWHMFTSLDP